ncbi:MAG: hypothetical protein QW145_01225 [Candidatus Bathyarchaeia archaeon]
MDIAALSESIVKLEGEVERTRKSISQSEMQIKRIEETIEKIVSQLEEDKSHLSSLEAKIREINEREKSLSEILEKARNELNLLETHGIDTKRESLASELIALKQKYSHVESEISVEKSKIEAILKRNIKELDDRINETSTRIIGLEKEIDEATKENDETLKRIRELEDLERNISEEISGFRERIKGFMSEIDALDNELALLEREYENGIKILNDLEIKLQTINLRINQLKERLRAPEYEGIDLPDLSQYADEDTDSQIKSMLDEVKRIGAVNQLAETQYIEQVSRYKELSIRLNDLEREKLAILKFIEEIEQKKMKIFMEAFNRINERLNNYFSRLTGGGTAYLKLENPDNPFAGGVDMVVQFPNKHPILVSGASSGERSVSAVAFLFALQEFSPASFYLFDEIDAHLDAFHVEKLGELLAEEASKMQLQFIVITLKPEMISKADRVYGVYGQNGVSHVVSMTFKGVA